MATLHEGQKINRLTILNLDHKDNRHRKFYKMRCDCGTEKIIHGAALISGNTRSCGCIATEQKRKKLLPESRGVINQVILGYKRHARDRGFLFELTFDDVSKIISLPCHYCGIKESNTKITKNCKGGFKYNGIDRLDSLKDYTPDNVVPCCKVCNRAKVNMTVEEFLGWVERIHFYQTKTL